MNEPTRCAHPACGHYSFAEYCKEHTPREAKDATQLRGTGIVTPPAKVRATRPRYVRRNEGFIVAGRTKFGGTWYPYEPAPYLEFAKDVARGRKARLARDARKSQHIVAQSRADHNRQLHAKIGPSNGGNPDA